MKKLLTFSLLLFGLFLMSPDLTKASSLSDLDSTRELHLELKDKGFVYLNEEGLIVISDDFSSLGINGDLAEEYKEVVNILNSNLEAGIISIDKDLDIQPVDVSEVAETVYENDKKNEDNGISLMSTYLNVTSLVETNTRQLEDQYNAVYSYSPNSAYSFSVGWWVGKVREGGAWDYKVVSGFSPWYKTFSMGLYSGTEVHNSKWLGNYNYGYTGQFLFSERILLAGGDAISLALNWVPDSQDVKNTISRAFRDGRAHY